MHKNIKTLLLAAVSGAPVLAMYHFFFFETLMFSVVASLSLFTFSALLEKHARSRE